MADNISGTVTNAGARYIAQRSATLQPVKMSHFVLANIPGVDENTVANANAGLPASAHIVGGNIPIDGKPRYNNDNAVTYSLLLDHDAGNYDFNYYGIVTDTGVLFAFQYIPTVKKRKGIGQVINRNLVTPFSNAKYLTGAALSIESWQFNYEDDMYELQLSTIKNAVAQMSLLNTAMSQHERLLKLEGKL